MRLLAVADEEDEFLCARLAAGDLPKVDVVVSGGDLRPSYLDYVATMANAPLLYVRGNHDTDGAGYDVMGGTPLDMRVENVGGLRIAGLDGSLDYREGIVGYSEAHMCRRAFALAAKAQLAGGVDVLVTHAPPRGYGDLDDAPHRGFVCYNWLLNLLRPRLMLCGHVHLTYGRMDRERMHPSGARIVNAYGYWLESRP
jgi:Icc-related predicted phosphoesterase